MINASQIQVAHKCHIAAIGGARRTDQEVIGKIRDRIGRLLGRVAKDAGLGGPFPAPLAISMTDSSANLRAEQVVVRANTIRGRAFLQVGRTESEYFVQIEIPETVQPLG